MKNNTILFLSILFLLSFKSYSQIEIIEDFENISGYGVPDDWSSSTNFSKNINSMTVCTGSAGVYNNMYNAADYDGFLVSPNTIGLSNETDLTLTFQWRTKNYGTGFDYTVDVEYTTDGTTWISISNFQVDSLTDCTTFSEVISAADLPSGSDFQFRIGTNWISGNGYFYVDNVVAQQVATSVPNCDATLKHTIMINPIGDISWTNATGIPTGYKLNVGTTSGGNDILDTIDVGNITSYNMGSLSISTTYYITITPYNGIGDATGCIEQTFETWTPTVNDLCSNAIALTVGRINTENVILSNNAGATATDSETDPTCNYDSALGDIWFEAVVPFTGNINFEVLSEEGSEITNVGMEILSGDCNSMTSIICQSYYYGDNINLLELTGQTPGDTLLCRLWEPANDVVGEFNVVAYDPTDYIESSQQFCADGYDDDVDSVFGYKLVLEKTNNDITVNEEKPIYQITLDNFVSHFNTEDGITTYCGNYYSFNVNVDGTEIITEGCADDINGTIITNFNTLTITPANIDNWAEYVYICVDAVVLHEPIECYKPMNLSVTDVTQTTVTTNWVSNGDENSWSIEYGEKDFSQIDGGIVISGLTQNSFALAGLQSDTSYDFYVKADCDINSESVWEGPFTFTTLYEVGCGIQKQSHLMENAFPCDKVDNGTAANDIVVPMGSDMIISKIFANVTTSHSSSVLNVDVSFYEDDNGKPGNLINIQTDIIPTSSTLVGQASWHLDDFHTIELDITPFTLIGDLNVNKTYWIGLSVQAEDNLNTYWETSTDGELIGYGLSYDLGNGQGFTTSSETHEGVYIFIGECVTHVANVENLSIKDFIVYPNPASNHLNLSALNNIKEINIYDVIGSKVYSKTFNSTQTSINIESLSEGTYFIKVNTENEIGTYKFIKK